MKKYLKIFSNLLLDDSSKARRHLNFLRTLKGVDIHQSVKQAYHIKDNEVMSVETNVNWVRLTQTTNRKIYLISVKIRPQFDRGVWTNEKYDRVTFRIYPGMLLSRNPECSTNTIQLEKYEKNIN